MYLRIAGEYLDHVSSPEPFEKRHVEDYLSWKRRRGCSGSTLRHRYYALKALFKALGRPWPLEKPPAASTPRRPMLTLEEMAAMEEAARRRSPRDLALVMLENTVGLRRTEIRNLNISDYRRPWIWVKTGKKGRRVRRELDPRTCDALDRWIRIRRRKRRQEDPDALFVRGTRGPRLSLRGLSHILAEIRREAGVERPGAGFHAIRRRVVTDLHQSGLSAPELTREFGWRSLRTVDTYIRLSKEDVEEKIRRIHRRFRDAQEAELERIMETLSQLGPEARARVLEELREGDLVNQTGSVDKPRRCGAVRS